MVCPAYGGDGSNDAVIKKIRLKCAPRYAGMKDRGSRSPCSPALCGDERTATSPPRKIAMCAPRMAGMKGEALTHHVRGIGAPRVMRG